MEQHAQVCPRCYIGGTESFGEQQLATEMGKGDTHQKTQETCHQGHYHVFHQYLSHDFHPCASKSTANTDFAHPLTEAALCHAAQVDGWNDKQYQIDNQTATVFGSYIKFQVSCLVERCISQPSS